MRTLRDSFVAVLVLLVVTAGPVAGQSVFEQPVSMDSPPRNLTTLLEELQSVPVVRAKFTETRHLKSLTRPLRSEGTLVFARSRGLYRHLIRPVVQEQFVGPEGLIVERLPDGETNRMDLSGQPRGRFVTLTFDLFAGRLARSEASMNVFFRGTGDTWTIGLRPSQSNQFLRWLKLSGQNRRITRLEMVHSSGDTTVTRFRETTFQDALTKEQKAVFRSLNGEE